MANERGNFNPLMAIAIIGLFPLILVIAAVSMVGTIVAGIGYGLFKVGAMLLKDTKDKVLGHDNNHHQQYPHIAAAKELNNNINILLKEPNQKYNDFRDAFILQLQQKQKMLVNDLKAFKDGDQKIYNRLIAEKYDDIKALCDRYKKFPECQAMIGQIFDEKIQKILENKSSTKSVNKNL